MTTCRVDIAGLTAGQAAAIYQFAEDYLSGNVEHRRYEVDHAPQRGHVDVGYGESGNRYTADDVTDALARGIGHVTAPAIRAADTLIDQEAARVVAQPVGELDSAGIPWNADVHANTKTKTDDGRWRARRGVDKAALAAYNAQFAGQARPTPAWTPPPQQPSTVQTQPVAGVTPDVAAFAFAAQPGPAYGTAFAPPAAPAPVAPQPEHPQAIDYEQHWYPMFAKLFQSGKLTTENMEQINALAGVADPNTYVTDARARAISFQYFQQLDRV